MTQENANRTLMLKVLAAFKDGILEPLFEALSPQVEWKTTAPPEFFRFGGVHRGPAGVREYTALLASRYHFLRLDPLNVTAKGDQVWGLFAAEAVHHLTGRVVHTDIFYRWTVKDGLITQHQCLFDTASVLIQQGELSVRAA
jgi:ketosteroid isomerase-like protein